MAASRLQSLQEILHEDLSPDILSEHLRTVSSFAEQLDVDEAYEKAIENTRAEKVKGFIVQSAEELFTALPILKEKGLKRTAFMPLNPSTLREGSDFPISDYGPDSAVIGRAVDFVKVRQEFAPLAASLLRNVLIVKNLPSALAFMSTLPVDRREITLVTMNGDTIDPTGTIMAGESKGILRRKRETRELEEEISRKTAETQNLSALLSSSEKDIEDQELLLRETQSVIVQSEKELSLLRLTAEKQEEEKERISRKISYPTLESEEISRELSSLKERVMQKETAISTVSAVKNDAETFLFSIQEEIARGDRADRQLPGVR